MTSDGQKDQNEANKLVLLLFILGGILVAAITLGGFMFGDQIISVFAPGIGLKQSSIIAFIASMVVMVVFAFAAGDGIIGEIQFMLGGFFSFFLVLWLLIAWVF